jgi:hypothetical protein
MDDRPEVARSPTGRLPQRELDSLPTGLSGRLGRRHGDPGTPLAAWSPSPRTPSITVRVSSPWLISHPRYLLVRIRSSWLARGEVARHCRWSIHLWFTLRSSSCLNLIVR